MRTFRLTGHCRSRMAEMHLEEGEVMDVAEDPEVTWSSTTPTGCVRTVAQRGELGVVIAQDGAIITVLWRKPDQWTRRQFRQEVSS